MKSIRIKLPNALLAAGFLSANVSAMACQQAEAPLLPDPDTAVIAEMVKAQKEMKRFVVEQENYLACEKNAEKHNQAVDGMKSMAAQFNDIVRKYKARVKA